MFKNSFGVKSSYPYILDAFIQEAEKLGWKRQGGLTEPKDSLYFNGNQREEDDLQTGHFWQATWSALHGYILPNQWNKAIKAASEIKEDEPVVLLTDENLLYNNGKQVEIRNGEEYYRVLKNDTHYEKNIAKKQFHTSNNYVRFKTEKAAEDYCNLQNAIHTAGIKIGDDGIFSDKPYSGSLPYNDSGMFYDSNKNYYIIGFVVDSDKYYAKVQMKKNTNGYIYYIEVENLLSNPVTIGNYTPSINGNYIEYGCQSFRKDDLQMVHRLLTSPINAKIKIQDTDITVDMVNTLLSKLNK